MEEKITTLEASGEFPFTFYIEKAVAEESETELLLEGVASTTNIDHDNERMSKEALQDMANIINEKSVPLRVEHSKSDNAVIGRVFKAWVDERNQLHIRASLDKSHPVSPILHHAMKSEGKKMGFSVGGLVKRAVKEFASSAGKLVKTFYDVELKEVSVTPRPANYDSWAISKSIAKDEAEAETTRGSAFYDEFLFANPQLDYLQAFAKSVPDEAWHKIEVPFIKNNNDMTKIEVKKADDKKEEDETTTEEKAVSRTEFNTVVKGIETLAESLQAIVKSGKFGKAEDDEKKDDEKEEEKTAKAEGDEDKKDEKEEEKTAKAEDDEKKDDKKGEYEIDSVERSIARLEAMTKTLQSMSKAEDDEDKKDEEEKTAKAEDDKEEDEEKEKSQPHQLDQFVVAVTKTIEAMQKAMTERGATVLGLEKSMVDKIVSDASIQEEIAKMMKMPGRKQSMSLGVPYMVTKEGKRFALTANEVGASTIEKSKNSDGKVSFKEMYKKDYSSVREEEDAE